MLGNTEIKRIMSEGGVLWKKGFRWTKQRVERDSLGYFTKKFTQEEMKNRYPKYLFFEFKDTGFGTFETFGYYTLGEIEIITSDNKNDYPLKGIDGTFYYELIS